METTAQREFAAAWQPQQPGRRAARDIRDAIVEPVWGGLRAVAALDEPSAALFTHGQEIAVPAELTAALRDAFMATEAVVEGNLTTMALRSGEGVFPQMPSVERPPLLVPRGLFKSVKDDPYVRARDHVLDANAAEAAILDALAAGERHAFVATDLLWLDGQPLLDIPLLERKRLLETVVDTSYLVRVSVFVRSSALATLITWGALGFAELSWRGANSRYLPGRENPDWAVARPPRGPHGAATAPPPPR